MQDSEPPDEVAAELEDRRRRAQEYRALCELLESMFSPADLVDFLRALDAGDPIGRELPAPTIAANQFFAQATEAILRHGAADAAFFRALTRRRRRRAAEIAEVAGRFGLVPAPAGEPAAQSSRASPRLVWAAAVLGAVLVPVALVFDALSAEPPPAHSLAAVDEREAGTLPTWTIPWIRLAARATSRVTHASRPDESPARPAGPLASIGEAEARALIDPHALQACSRYLAPMQPRTITYKVYVQASGRHQVHLGAWRGTSVGECLHAELRKVVFPKSQAGGKLEREIVLLNLSIEKPHAGSLRGSG